MLLRHLRLSLVLGNTNLSVAQRTLTTQRAALAVYVHVAKPIISPRLSRSER
jgi:hypothetical protein